MEGKTPGADEVLLLMMEGYNFSEEEIRLLDTFARMYGSALGNPSTHASRNVSLFEIPAMMQKRFAEMHFASLLVYIQKFFLEH